MFNGKSGRKWRVPLASWGVVSIMALALGACGSGDSDADGPAKNEPVRITLWAWYPAFQPVVDRFNATHDDIQIDWTNAGVGPDEYTKLKTAFTAGSGAPDVVMIANDQLPTIIATDHLVDVGKYGAEKVRKNYGAWAWDQVSDGKRVYGIPQDAGPMGLLYRKDIFDKYGLKVPRTWEEFKQEGEKLKAADSKTYMTDFGINRADFMTALMAQAGARPYTFSQSKLPDITIDINNEAGRNVMAYWQDLISEGLADTTSMATPDFYNGLGSGKYATYLAAAWGPGYLQGVAESTSGLWRVAPLPQWSEGGGAQTVWGGSSLAVTDQSKHPAEAAQVAREIFGTDKTAWKIGIDQAFIFPAVLPILEWDYFKNKTYKFFGDQPVNQIFIQAYNGLEEFDHPPFVDYVYNQMTTKIGGAAASKGSLTGALDDVQTDVTRYAEEQGLKVRN